MPDGSTLSIFIAAAAILLITPGPAVLYIVARSIDQGRFAGIVSTLGINFGTLFHIAAAAFGISALLLSSALALNVVKYLGAAYLVYLGLRKILSREKVEQPIQIKRHSLSRIFYEGALVNLLNPKTALFFFAFLPQFVDPSKGSAAAQIMMLGSIFIVMAILSDSFYALLAGAIGNWLKGNMRFWAAQRFFSGGVYIALGIVTAFSGPGKNK